MEPSRDSQLACRDLPLVIGRNSIRWIHDNLSYFNPFAESRLSQELRHNALAELALFCLVAKRHKEFRSLPELHGIVSFIENLNSNPFFEASLRRWNELIIRVLILTAALEAYGLASAHDRRSMIQKIVWDSNACIIERIPYRRLELRYILDLGGFSHCLPSYHELWNPTLLGHEPNLMFLSDNDVYSITHVLFYLTDFSAREPSLLAPRDAERIHEQVCHLLGVHIRRENWDLVSELLMAERCLRRSSRYSVIGWRALMEAQQADGRITGPQVARLAESALNTERLFECCYHTTLVAAFAGTLCRGRVGRLTSSGRSGS